MYTNKEELKSHMNISDIDVITESDDAIVEGAIDTAISETKGYLGKYDTVAIFGAEAARRHPLLLTFVKDIAVWHLVVLSNYKADIELRKDRYNRAVSWLKGVQKGDITPDLPIGQNAPGQIIYGSNPKRFNHF